MKTELLIGTLLGDAYIQKVKNRPRSYCFSFQQSNYDYAKWKADNSGLSYTIHTRDRYDNRTEKTYRVTTVLLKLDKDLKDALYNLFYCPKKQITDKILALVTPMTLAVWYMDDGNLYYNGNNCHITLSVNGFSLEERTKVIDWFKTRYDLDFKHSQKAIRLTSRKQCQGFMDIVERHIPDCMKYKTLEYGIRKHKQQKG
jgi:hypothetical protein